MRSYSATVCDTYTHVCNIPLTKYSQTFLKCDFNYVPYYKLILKYQVLPLGHTDTITLAVVVVPGLWSAGTFIIVGLWGYNS